ncbi:MAG: hypothetical protein ACFFD2_24480 [Promethearchaeota archaeon]
MINLTILKLDYNRITAVDGREFPSKIYNIWLDRNLIEEVHDLPLGNIEFHFEQNHITSIEGLEDFIQRETIYLSGNPVLKEICERFPQYAYFLLRSGLHFI